MKIIIFGTTGTAGSEVVRQAIADPEIEQITVVVRKPLDFKHPKMYMIVHGDFLDYNELLPAFRESNVCIWCLGISQNKVSKEQYAIITYDYVMAAARSMLSVNPEIAFVFLSGQGADSSEKSRILFARVKGKTENALKSLPFKRLYILRPSGIVPVNQPEELTFSKKMKFMLRKLMVKIVPQLTISTVQLAKSMLTLVKTENNSSLLENRNIKEIVNTES